MTLVYECDGVETKFMRAIRKDGVGEYRIDGEPHALAPALPPHPHALPPPPAPPPSPPPLAPTPRAHPAPPPRAAPRPLPGKAVKWEAYSARLKALGVLTQVRARGRGEG